MFAITHCEAITCGGPSDSLESTVAAGLSGWTPPKEFRRDVHIKATSERAAGSGFAAQLCLLTLHRHMPMPSLTSNTQADRPTRQS